MENIVKRRTGIDSAQLRGAGMVTRVGINGFGRIGRQAFKIALQHPELEVVAINDIGDVANMAYLLKYDSVYGRDDHEIHSEGNILFVDGKQYPVLKVAD